MWRGLNVAFRDVLMAILFGFLLAAMAIPPEKKASDSNAPLQGSVVIELLWDKARDADVDLWVQAPGDVPVGYSNKSGIVFNLIRDDLGKSGDPLSANMEMAIGRGIQEGEYTVNAHLYRSTDGVLPIHGKVAMLVRDNDGTTHRLLIQEFDLTFLSQEITVFRFKLNQDGTLIQNSVNHSFKPVRSAWMKEHPSGPLYGPFGGDH